MRFVMVHELSSTTVHEDPSVVVAVKRSCSPDGLAGMFQETVIVPSPPTGTTLVGVTGSVTKVRKLFEVDQSFEGPTMVGRTR